MCEAQRFSGALKGECKNTKIKNKRQVTMMKGNRSAGGQRAQGDDLPISGAAGGNQSVGSAVWRSRIVISNNPEINRQSIGNAERGNPNLGSPPGGTSRIWIGSWPGGKRL